MSPTLPPPKRRAALDTLFEHAEHWTYSDTGHFKVDLSDTTHLVPSSVLGREHFLLPLVLKHMIDARKDQSGLGKMLDGYYAYLTRELLLCPPVEVMDVDGSITVLACITRIYPVDTMGDVLGISATKVSTEVATIDEHAVHMVTSYKKKCLELPACFLEAQYPGCTKRWTIGHSLDVDRDQLMQYVFTASSESTMLPELTHIIFE